MEETSGEVLKEHTAVEEQRYAEIVKNLETIKGKVMADEAKVVNMLGGTDGGAGGLGMGGGLIGGLVLGSLLRNGNLLGNGDNLNRDNNDTMQIMQSLGDIKASIPFNEGQVQLVLAGAAANLTSIMNTNALSAATGVSGINDRIAEASATAASGQSDIRRDIASANAVNIASFSSLQQTVLNGNYAVTQAIRDDGDKTRAILVSQNETMLNHQLAVAEAALLEQRGLARVREVEVNVSQTMINNQTQAQQQQQQAQWQQVIGLIANLANDIQYVRATNQAINIGSGSMVPVQTNSSTNNRVNS
jgi:hypothetical protein